MAAHNPGFNALVKNKMKKFVNETLREDSFATFSKSDAVVNTQRAMDEISSGVIMQTFADVLDNADKATISFIGD